MNDAVVRTRMAAAERQAGIVEAATRVFARGTYGGTSTAQIAREAGVNEALLFRHFGTKRGLYVACIDAAWAYLRDACDAAIEQEPDPALHWRMLGRAFLGLGRTRPELARMWAQALTEVTGVEEIDAHLAEVMQDIHAFAADILERSRAVGGIVDDRNVRAEAWIVVALGLLGTIGQRLGPVVNDDFEAVLASHRAWLTGDPR